MRHGKIEIMKCSKCEALPSINIIITEHDVRKVELRCSCGSKSRGYSDKSAILKWNKKQIKEG